MSSYQYNGLGDRLQQTVDGIATDYTLDLNTGLTQVLYDGTNTYTYGLGRISQQNGSTPEYFLGDALGSVRQMTDQAGAITFAQTYDPYGVVTHSSGLSHTDYGFTGESYSPSTQLTYLRARYYNPADGRFTSRDTWSGDVKRPLSMNRWGYVEGNPTNYSDPTGHDGVPDWVGDVLKSMRAKTEECYNNGNRECVWQNYYALSFFAPLFGYPHASDHLENYLLKLGDRHYFGGVGVPNQFIMSSKWVFEDNIIRRPLRQETKEMWRLIHLDALTGQTEGHIETKESPSNYPEGPTDTWYALGDFYVSVEANYKIDGCNVTVEPIYHFRDEYDWHPGLVAGGGVGGLAGFQDSWAASLKPDMASEYTNFGSWFGPNKIYQFSNTWFDAPPNNNVYLSWEYADNQSANADLFHFDD